MGKVFVQTNSTLLMYDEHELISDVVTDENGVIVTDDVNTSHVINA